MDIDQLIKGTGIKIKVMKPDEKIDRISTGSMAMDFALGGGWAKARVNNISGVEAYGKTTLMLQAIRQFIKIDDRPVIFVDNENRLDPNWIKRNGIPMDRIRVVRSMTETMERLGQEQMLEFIHRILQTGGIGLLVMDSLADMQPDQTGMGDRGDPEYGKRMMGIRATNFDHFFSSTSPLLLGHDTTMMTINQLRDSLAPHGDPFVEPGGRAKNHKFCISVRLTKPEKEIVDDELFRITFNGYTKKNNTFHDGMKFSAIFMIDEHNRLVPDVVPEICDIGKKLRVFTNKEGEKLVNGTWHFNGEPFGDGSITSLDKAIRLLATNVSIREEVLEAVYAAMEKKNVENNA